MGGGETVIVFDLVAAVLAVAAIGYLVVALVKPERF
ncbi:MAG TPA: potassium-transporting ATPase subunit F [Terrimesophilobacter sp.]